MFSLLTILLLVFAYYLLPTKTKPDPVNKIYERFCKKMKKRGYIKQGNETATCFAKRIIKNEPELQSAIMKITTKYNSLHYGKYQTKMMLQVFEDSINTLKI